MKRYINIILLFACILFANEVYAQNRSVSGVIVDSSNEPLVGATISAKGFTGIGTITDINGAFTFSVPQNIKKLEITYVGFASKVVDITALAKKNTIVLEEDASQLEEVVVVGYGSLRKSDLTGSVTSVEINSIEASSANSVQSMLGGRAAGVQVTSTDGAPGTAINIKIRGNSSLTGDSEPLYVVDGIIMNSPSGDVPSGGPAMTMNFQQAQNGLSGISSQDIASMEILKDASATAIYGSLGANGVVLITTKSGSSEKAKVQYSGSMTVSTMANKKDMLNLEDYATYLTDIAGQTFTTEGKRYMDWQDDSSRTAIGNNHRISVSRKTQDTNYFIAGGFTNSQGIIKETDVKQFDLRLNLDHDFTKNIKFGTKTSFMYTETGMTKGANTAGGLNGGLIRQMVSYRPYLSTVLDEDDEEILDDDDMNSGPRSWLSDYHDNSYEYRFLSTMYADIKLFKWFSMRTSFGIDYRNKTRENWYGLKLYQGADNNGIASTSSLNMFRYNFDHMFNILYSKSKHRINGTVGFTMTSALNKNNFIGGSQFGDNVDLAEDGLEYATLFSTPAYNKSLVNSVSFLGRANYSYDDRYILTATIRGDATSKFAKGNRLAYFPSLALAYRINREHFLRNVKQISNLKLRLGWGVVGNQNSAAYQTMATFNSGGYADAFGGYITGVFPSNIPNPHLKWETTRQFNIGLDFGAFDNRINFSADLYDKRSSDLLQQVDIPISTGFTSQWINRGSISNRGLELVMDGDVVRSKNLHINLSGNISFNKSKIIDIGLPEGQFGAHTLKAMWGKNVGASNYLKQPVNIFAEGYASGMFFGIRTDGIVQQHEFEADQSARTAYVAEHGGTMEKAQGILPTYNGKLLQAGDPRYVDMDGDGNVDPTADKTFLGNPNPKFNYGFGMDVTYKNFNLNVLFSGSYGNKIINANHFMESDPRTFGNGVVSNISNIRYDAFYNIYTDERPSTVLPRWNYTGNSGELTNMCIEDGSFLRLSSLVLSYSWNFKKKNYFIKGASVDLTCRNLFVITDYKGYDPEVSSFNDPLKVGIDWASYPNNRSYTVGLRLDF